MNVSIRYLRYTRFREDGRGTIQQTTDNFIRSARRERERDAIRRGRGLRTYQLGAGSTEPIGASADHLQCRCPEARQLLMATIKMELPRSVGKRCRGRCRAWVVRRQERASHTPRPLTRVRPILLHARFNERESVELSSDTWRVLRSTMEWPSTARR